MKPSGTFLYFAYGSNMLSARLLARTPSAVVLGRARLSSYSLAWHKVGIDDTGKCDIVPSGHAGDHVHGVAYQIRLAELRHLDLAEELGTGYFAGSVAIDVNGRQRLARTYRAIPTDPILKPLTWYKRFVVEGAREHGLPSSYIARLKAAPALPDPDRNRSNTNWRISNRRSA